MHDLKQELASLRLDDEPPRSRRGAGGLVLLVFTIAGAILWWQRGVFAAAEVLLHRESRPTYGPTQRRATSS